MAAVPSRAPTLRVTPMPADTNIYGDIFGGWLMCHMDQAAGLAASRRVRGRAVTVAVDSMAFLAPVAVGDEVSVYADALEPGRTSIRIRVEAWRRPRESEAEEKVTEAVFTFVAIDEDRRPTPIGPDAPAGASETAARPRPTPTMVDRSKPAMSQDRQAPETGELS